MKIIDVDNTFYLVVENSETGQLYVTRMTEINSTFNTTELDLKVIEEYYKVDSSDVV